MQQVSRRQFARVLAGPAAVFATGGPVAWRPSPRRGSRRLLIHGLSTAAGLFEFRVYGSRPRAMPAILERHGIRPAWREHSANSRRAGPGKHSMPIRIGMLYGRART
jgi:hypothetical protein